MVGNTELFLFWFLDVQNNFMFPTIREQSKVGKFSEINKQFHVKSWLTYWSYSSVWWILSCTVNHFKRTNMTQNDNFFSDHVCPLVHCSAGKLVQPKFQPSANVSASFRFDSNQFLGSIWRNWTGVDRTGLHLTSLKRTGPDRQILMFWTGPDWTRLEQIGTDWTRLDQIGLDRNGPYWTGL